MSTRRLAQEQPASFAFTPESMKEVSFWLAKYPSERRRSAVIPLLWIAQKQAGWVTEPAIRVVAGMLDMPVMRVLEVATFYTMFNLERVGRFHIQLCGTTPCMLRGSEALKDLLAERIGPVGSVTADGVFSWMETECLGACCNAPMVQISTTESDHYYEDLTPQTLGKVMDDLAAGKTPKPGPQTGRRASAPMGKPTSLTDPSLYDGSRAAPLTAIPNAPAKA
jgi:NADH-quinone oxidoreductase subunit E